LSYNVCYYTDMKPRRTDPEQPDAVDAATDAVLLASRVLVGIAAQSLAATETQITLPQYRALVVLGTRGAQTVGTLADTLGIHPSTLTRLCDRLITRGLIDRATSPENRREVILALSEAGRTLVRTETTRRRRAIGTLVERFDHATQREITHAFGALADAAGEVPHHAWKLGWTA
jgi:DNA-binding MarR family transcriptional regulator